MRSDDGDHARAPHTHSHAQGNAVSSASCRCFLMSGKIWVFHPCYARTVGRWFGVSRFWHASSSLQIIQLIFSSFGTCSIVWVPLQVIWSRIFWVISSLKPSCCICRTEMQPRRWIVSGSITPVNAKRLQVFFSGYHLSTVIELKGVDSEDLICDLLGRGQELNGDWDDASWP